jgi:hypothetical protein
MTRNVMSDEFHVWSPSHEKHPFHYAEAVPNRSHGRIDRWIVREYYRPYNRRPAFTNAPYLTNSLNRLPLMRRSRKECSRDTQD